MNNIFKLKFNNALTNLTGNTLGRNTFKNQVAKSVDFSKKIVIIFPDSIDNIGTAFIQGFFEKFVKNIGISGVKNNVDIIAPGIPNIKDIVIKKLSL